MTPPGRVSGGCLPSHAVCGRVGAVDLAVLGSLGIGLCWGWLLAPVSGGSAGAAAWMAASSVALAAEAAAVSSGVAAGWCLAGVAAGLATHLGWRRQLRRTSAR